MASKRDLQFVRLAVRRKWLTAEEGEDVLFLKRKFGQKFTIEEVIRRRQYLDDDAIDELSAGVDQVAPRRRRRRFRPDDEANRVTKDIVLQQPLDSSRSEAQTASSSQAQDPDAHFVPDPGATMIAPNPLLASRDLAASQELVVRPPVEDEPPPDFADRTIFDEHPGFDQPDEAATIFGLNIENVMAEVAAAKARKAADEEAARQAEEPILPLPDSALSTLHESGSMPGESLATLMLGEQVSQEVTADAVPVLGQPVIVEPETVDGELYGQFGRYEIRRTIARGMHSVVYLAESAEAPQPVALKVLSGGTRDFIADRAEDLVAAARIESPHVVRVLDVGRVNERAYVALQYVDGWTLDEMLDTGERPGYVRVAEIGRDIAKGLADAEWNGVVHGDVRPDNILLTQDGAAFLTGFGFAPRVRAGGDLVVQGTPGFMAPEQVLGEAPDLRSDLYGLGATLYRLATGRGIFEGVDLADLMLATAEQDVVDPRKYNDKIPPALAETLLSLLARRPQDRFQSANEVAERFDQIAFELQAAGFEDAAERHEAISYAPVMLRAAATAMLVVAVAIVIPTFLLRWRSDASFATSGALVGAACVLGGTILLGTLALIRQGQIPLTLSTAWLVRAQEALSVIGAGALTAGFVVAPEAILNLLVATLAIMVLVSLCFGSFLRRAVAGARPDGGVGRMLAVLGDPLLVRWRSVHAPLLSVLCSLAIVRFALVAYFAATG